MLCDNCKSNSATLHYNQNINGEIKEYNLCENCANGLKTDILFSNMFKDFFSIIGNNLIYNQREDELNLIKCNFCGNDLNSFKRTGKMGCANCYDVFKEKIIPIIKNIQSDNNHTGKIPKKAGAELKIQRELKVLKENLEFALKNEDYEAAIIFRDEIKKIKGGF